MRQNAGFLLPVRLGQAPGMGTPQSVLVQLFERNGPPIPDQRIEVTYMGPSGSGGMDRRTDNAGTAIVEVPGDVTMVRVTPMARAGRVWSPPAIEMPMSPGVRPEMVFSAVPVGAPESVPPPPMVAPETPSTALLVGGLAALGLVGYWIFK